MRQYNELFNSTRPREYNGEHIHFVGMNPEISLREHQRNAIAHVLYGGNTLLAHEVGAGKTFEQLGVDRLFVDESHAFKNLFLHTKMRNVAGLSTSEAQKSYDMFGKCRYLDEVTGGRGVIFATGTPVSNSMTVRP